MKKNSKTREAPHPSLNPLVKVFKEKLLELEDESNDRQDIVKLKSHKKKALLFTLPNFPAATSVAYTIPNVMKGFIYNGQLDVESTSVPSLKNLCHTYRGDVSECCLNDRDKLLDNYFEEMYLNGTIMEKTFDDSYVPVDKDSNDNAVLKSNSISTENRHRAKVLSSDVQINERRKLVNERRIDEYNVRKKQFDSEQRKHDLNIACEKKLVQIIIKTIGTDSLVTSVNQSNIEFQSVQDHLTLSVLQENLSSLRINELKAFVKVRSQRTMKRGKISFGNVPTHKDMLVKKCYDMRAVNYTEQMCSVPVYPSLLPVDD